MPFAIFGIPWYQGTVKRRTGQWDVNKGIAEAILRDRMQRRKVLSFFAFLLMGMFALGLWGIEGWLLQSPWRFGLYWGACALLALFVMLFALFDALSVIKEERER